MKAFHNTRELSGNSARRRCLLKHQERTSNLEAPGKVVRFRLGCHNLPRIWMATLQCPGHRECAPSAMLANRATHHMNTIMVWRINVRACSTSETDILGSLSIGQWSSLCGRQTCMALPV